MDGQFLAISQDPRIVPRVHHYCDEWCDYCPVTRRCLAFRCTEAYRQQRGRKEEEETFSTMEEAIAFTRQVAAIEGIRTDELDELLAHPPGESGVRTDDPLAERALDYAARTELLLLPVALQLASRRSRPSPGGPSPEEVIVWYHARIYMKIFRGARQRCQRLRGRTARRRCTRVREAGDRVDRPVARGAAFPARHRRRRPDRSTDSDTR